MQLFNYILNDFYCHADQIVLNNNYFKLKIALYAISVLNFYNVFQLIMSFVFCLQRTCNGTNYKMRNLFKQDFYQYNDIVNYTTQTVKLFEFLLHYNVICLLINNIVN